jgi:hypothetical protein
MLNWCETPDYLKQYDISAYTEYWRIFEAQEQGRDWSYH